MSRSRDDVIVAAGRLFAARGYHGTSMRDLGKELGLEGSSLYAHIEGKQQLLVEVIDRGAALFQSSADAALTKDGTAADRLRALIEGHISVVLEHKDEVGTFLDQASALDKSRRSGVVASRDRYEDAFRTVLKDGAADGSFDEDIDPVTSSIFILSILNAIGRWYHSDGVINRTELGARLYDFVLRGISSGR